MITGGEPQLIRGNPEKTTRYGRNKALTSGVDMILTGARSVMVGIIVVRTEHMAKGLTTPDLKECMRRLRKCP